MTRFFLFVIGLLHSFSLFSQQFETVFPGLSGATLLDSLASRYRPGVVLDYANARDTLYARILGIDDDSLRCIYSGHTLYLDPTQDPTQYIYLNGSTNGMNTEHAYPQSKGAATGNARSDMHHIYPTRIAVNEARGDRPFAEIPDNQTDKWFYKNQVFTSIPAQNPGAYSEQNENYFEPREAVKGDLARSVFYFYTMYTAQANLADPQFFETQRNTLCQWNEDDPADQTELVKTWRIAPYQENKPNPYVLDCTLAFRTFCAAFQPGCTNIGTETPAEQLKLALKLSPNPFAGMASLDMVLPDAGRVQGRWTNLLGQSAPAFELLRTPAGGVRVEVAAPPFGGWCVLEVAFKGENVLRTGTLRIFVEK